MNDKLFVVSEQDFKMNYFDRGEHIWQSTDKEELEQMARTMTIL
jgi:hypothetical protein